MAYPLLIPSFLLTTSKPYTLLDSLSSPRLTYSTFPPIFIPIPHIPFNFPLHLHPAISFSLHSGPPSTSSPPPFTIPFTMPSSSPSSHFSSRGTFGKVPFTSLIVCDDEDNAERNAIDSDDDGEAVIRVCFEVAIAVKLTTGNTAVADTVGVVVVCVRLADAFELDVDFATSGWW